MMPSPAPIEEVPCNGPCRRQFRPAAVKMDQTIANFLLSSSRTPGLLWLCPECQRSFSMQQTTEGYVTELPPEIWIKIFRNLYRRDLLQVRLTCRCWRDIVDQNQPLRIKFWIGFKETIIDDQFQPRNLFPAASVAFDMSKIIIVEGWWSSLAVRLTSLWLSSCEIALPVLLMMLRETPNLTELTLIDTGYTSIEEIDTDFQLDKLIYLSCYRVLDVFRNIFPRLRELRLETDVEDYDEAKICRLMQSVQGTLKVLECTLTPFFLDQIACMDRLQLTNVVVYLTEGELVVQLSQMQNTIESLRVIATNKDLCEIGRNLKKLKEAEVVLEDDGTIVPSFLAEMHQLRVLKMEGLSGIYLNFKSLKSATLTHLQLESLSIPDGSLQNFLSNSPCLQELDISYCSLGSWSDIFVARLKSLRYLNVYNNRMVQDIMDVPMELGCLKKLRISTCHIPVEKIIELLLQCPRLEELTLCEIPSINDGFVTMLGQLPQLKKLHLYCDSLTDESLLLIAEKYSHLIVEISSHKISDAAIKLLSYVTHSG